MSSLFDNEAAKKHGLQTSYEELADNLAKRYRGFLSHAGFLSSRQNEAGLQPKHEPYTQIDVSHSFPIMSFLKKFLVFEDGVAAKDLAPQDFFDKIGGVIRESDSLELDYESHGGGYIVKVKGGFTPGIRFSGQLNLND